MQRKELRPPLHLDVIAIEKGAFGSPSTAINQFTCLYIHSSRQEFFKNYKSGNYSKLVKSILFSFW